MSQLSKRPLKVDCLQTDYHFTPNAIITNNSSSSPDQDPHYIQNYFNSNGILKNDGNGKWFQCVWRTQESVTGAGGHVKVEMMNQYHDNTQPGTKAITIFALF